MIKWLRKSRQVWELRYCRPAAYRDPRLYLRDLRTFMTKHAGDVEEWQTVSAELEFPPSHVCLLAVRSWIGRHGMAEVSRYQREDPHGFCAAGLFDAEAGVARADERMTPLCRQVFGEQPGYAIRDPFGMFTEF